MLQCHILTSSAFIQALNCLNGCIKLTPYISHYLTSLANDTRFICRSYCYSLGVVYHYTIVMCPLLTGIAICHTSWVSGRIKPYLTMHANRVPFTCQSLNSALTECRLTICVYKVYAYSIHTELPRAYLLITRRSLARLFNLPMCLTWVRTQCRIIGKAQEASRGTICCHTAAAARCIANCVPKL